jgi:predicted RNA binding protein YcfA (HicA-like mRNA interferase family)
MSKCYSSREVLAALRKAGFREVSQRGSHLKLRATRKGHTHTVILKHPSPLIPVGTFKSILRQAGLTMEEFEQLLA